MVDTQPPRSLGRYGELRLLGQGGMGAVYRARDPDLDRDVAIKVILDSHPDLVERFRREARALARLVHPNVVQVFDFGTDGQGHPYFVMELVEGRSLDVVLKEQGRLRPLEVARLLLQAARGLAAAHAAGVIHRDVKPSNMMLLDGGAGAAGRLKLVDFGLARMERAPALTAGPGLLGTPTYMAPEQVEGGAIDERTDVYALGISAFHMLAGRPPFDGTTALSLAMKHVMEELPSVVAAAPGTPPPLAALVVRMCQKDPGRRPRDCGEIVAALEGVIAALGGGDSDEAAGSGAAAAAAAAAEAAAEWASASSPQGASSSASSAASSPPGGAWSASSAASSAPGGVRSPSSGGARSPWSGAEGGPVAVGGTVPPARGGVPVVVVAVVGAIVAAAVAATVLSVRRRQPSGGPTATLDAPRATPAAAPPHAAPLPVVVAHPAAPAATGPVRVAVLRFRNLGGERDKELDFLVEGIGETVLSALVGGERDRVRILERAQLGNQTGELDLDQTKYFDPAEAARLGRMAGVEVAVQGAFQRVGKVLRVTARFVRVETGEILDTAEVTRPVPDAEHLLAVQDAIAAALKVRLLAVAAGLRR